MSFEVLISESEIKEKIKELGKAIDQRYGPRKTGDELVVVGVLKGSFIFLADLVRAVTIPVQIDFIEASSYGSGTVSSGEVKIVRDLKASIRDKDVLLVEDIVDTGITLTTLKGLLQLHGPRSVSICSLLHKPSRKIKEVAIEFLGFTIEDKFVIGYGLDFDERFRQLPSIQIFKE